MPLVTVYVTNYNYGKFIEQALESIYNQTFQDFELIIVDDGSTDNSKEIIESYATKEKTSVIFQKNKGLNVTNNIALKASKGKYIMRLDADDYLVESALEQMVAELEGNDELGLVFPNYYLVDEENIKLAEIKRFNFDEEVSLYDLPAHGAVTMIRVDFLKSLGGYDESYKCQDGYELWIKFITKYKVSNVSEPLFYYRQHGDNLTSNENKILGTRMKIKEDFTVKKNINMPNSVAIIPVRGQKLNNEYLAYTKLGEFSFLEIKINSVLESSLISKAVVTSHDQSILDFVSKKYSGNSDVITIKRPKEFARMNTSLNKTIDLVLTNEALVDMEGLAVLPIEYPFLKSKDIDDAIRTAEIFKADTILSVRSDSSTFYQHHGKGLVPILNQGQFTKLERDDLFKATGGVTYSLLKSYKELGKLVGGKIGHVMVDGASSIGVFSKFDLELANAWHKNSLKSLKAGV